MRRSGITAHEILADSYQDGDGSMMLTGGETEAEEASGVGVHTDVCACVRACVQTRGQFWISFSGSPHLITVRQGLSLGLELDSSAGLAGQQPPQNLLFPAPDSRGDSSDVHHT